MPQRFDSGWWSIELPDEWAKEGDQDLASFSTTGRHDALQISAARKPDGFVTEEDLRELAGGRVSGQMLSRVRYAYVVGFSVSAVKDRCAIKEWWLRAGRLMILVTYTVTEGVESRIDEVERIVNSLRPS